MPMQLNSSIHSIFKTTLQREYGPSVWKSTTQIKLSIRVHSKWLQMIQETQSFCGLLKNILNAWRNDCIYWDNHLFFYAKNRSIEKLRSPLDKLTGVDKDIKLPLYLFFDHRKVVIGVHRNSWVSGLGPFVQVAAILITTTSRRKSVRILFVCMVSASLFWHWDVSWNPAIHFIILKFLEVASRRKKQKNKSQHL